MKDEGPEGLEEIFGIGQENDKSGRLTGVPNSRGLEYRLEASSRVSGP